MNLCGPSKDRETNHGKPFRTNGRKGFTLAETVISFVLIGLVVLMVSGATVSNYIMASELKKLPNAYYREQDAIETKIAALQELIETRTRLQNEKNTTPYGQTAHLDEQLAEVDAQIRSQNVVSSSVVLFGKTVELYKFDSTEEESLDLYATVVNGERLSRPVPIIDSVEISCGGSTGEQYFSVGNVVDSKVEYNTKNLDYKWRETYQWYICTGNFHTYQENRSYGDILAGTIFASYPMNFTLLAGEKSSRLTITDEMEGHFICCVATPVSKEGKMGSSQSSNFMYISGLPELDSAAYAAVIDPSLAEIDYDEAGVTSSNTNIRLVLQSRYSNSSDRISFRVSSSTNPSLDLNGSLTGTGESSKAAFSRFLRLSGTQSLTADPSGSDRVKLFMVARKTAGGGDFDFIQSESGETEDRSTRGGYGTAAPGWYILSCTADATEKLHIKSGVEIAEILVLTPLSSDPVSEEDTESVIRYLAEKYGID